MSPALPERPSLEFLKKLAKERLAALRVSQPSAQLAEAQLAVAREHGIPSWRALKAEVDRRRAPALAAFFAACAAGDVAALRELLTADPGLARARSPDGGTALHAAVRHPDALRLLLAHGADANARDAGDNAGPLHLAAANGAVDSVRLLLDAGADVHGDGDLHRGGVIGWASRPGNQAVVDLLLARGARHHIFSAMALGDRALVQRVVEESPESLARRRSRFENGQTPVHAAFAPPDGLGYLPGAPDYALLALLIDLGADVDAADDKGRTPLAVALLRGDEEAIRLLRAAGAREPRVDVVDACAGDASLAAMSGAIHKGVPAINAPDIAATLDWYVSIGFTELARHEHDGVVNFGMLAFGNAQLALGIGPAGEPHAVSLWLYTDRIDDLYARFRQRQLDASRRQPPAPPVRFAEDLYTPFYGGRQFSVLDNNGVALIFYEPARS